MAESFRFDDYRAFYQKAKGSDRIIRLAVRKSIREAAKKYGPEIHAEAAAEMPHGGGADEYVAAKNAKPRVSQTTKGVFLVYGSKSFQVGRMNAGNLRHPVYGRRTAWANTSVKPGAWDKAGKKRLRDIRNDVGREINIGLKELNP